MDIIAWIKWIQYAFDISGLLVTNVSRGSMSNDYGLNIFDTFPPQYGEEPFSLCIHTNSVGSSFTNGE